MFKLLGIVTARSGSKGIPYKNLYPIAGMPLIYYCIEAAQGSGIFDRIIISTDDPKIAEVAKSFGVEVPFIRPKELAEDHTPHLPVIHHAVTHLMNTENYHPEYTAIIHPTAPCIQKWHWQEAFEKLVAQRGDSVIGVREMPAKYHPGKSFYEVEDGTLKMGPDRGKPRQLLPKVYYSTAGIYIFKTKNIFFGNFYGHTIIPYEIEEDYELDINNFEDIEEARNRIAFIKYPWIAEKDAELYEELKKEYEK